MHIITVSVTFLQLKYSFLMILKKGLLTELEKKKLRKKFSERQYNFLGRACFGWIGRSMANQHFFLSGPSKIEFTVYYITGN